jgi:sodium-dependent dicarboxylate transporter 2/3/5
VVKSLGIVLGIAAFLALILIDSPLHHHGDYGSSPAYAAAVTALMAIFWLTEALPIYATACLPLVLFPFVPAFEGGVLERTATAIDPYFDPYIVLFAGGMAVAAAMQQCDLHRRIALHVMRIIGTDPRRLLLGVLASTAFLSLWISNTATAAMMLPIGLAILAQSEATRGVRLVHFGAAVMLAIAYGANLGGIGTKIGTAPNAQFAQFMDQRGVEIGFLQFFAVGFPFVVLFLPIAWFVLWRVGRKDAPDAEAGRRAVAHELSRIGPMKRSERAVLAVFLATVALWIAGKPLTEVLRPSFTAFRLSSAHVEGGIAALAALAVLLLRVDGRRTLEWPQIRKVPWHTLLLLGGAFSMAEGVQQSGLSDWLGSRLVGLAGMHPFAQVLVAALGTVAISAVASNTATISVMLNVLASVIAPEHATTVLFAATIASSCDFALPAGTPPNAIVFGSGYLTVPRMAKTGVQLDVAAALVCGTWCYFAVPWFV